MTIVIVGLVVIVLSLNFFPKEVKGFFYSFSSPIQQVFWKTGDGIANFFGAIINSKNLQQENEQLQLILQGLLAENSSLEEVQRENALLREALEIGLTKDFRLALAEVISQDIGQDTVLINQGAKDGVEKDMPVITQERVLLGKVTEVYGDSSRVTLISSEGSSFDAKVSDGTVTGVVNGKGRAKLAFDLVPKEETLKEGDLIVTTALGGIYPKGLLVGAIRKAQKSDTQPFYQTEISPLFKADELTSIFVILNF